MKTTNIFYPNALIWLYNKLDCKIYVSFLLGFFFPYSILLLMVWYISDVIGNILYWIGMKLFVNLILWGLNKAETMIKKADLMSKTMEDCNEIEKNYYRNLFFWIRKK